MIKRIIYLSAIALGVILEVLFLVVSNFAIWACLPFMALLFVGSIFFFFKKKMRIISVFAFLISGLVIVPNCLVAFKSDAKDVEYIMHASGGYENHSYLNAQQSFLYYAENGNNLVELDFLYTADGEIFCSHYMEYFEDFDFENRPTLEEVKNSKLLGKYDAITFDWLMDTLETYPNIKIVFDTKETDSKALLNDMIAEALDADFDIKNRFIIQVYSKENYEDLQSLDFAEYWFTNYKAYYMPYQVNEYFGDKENVTTIVLYTTFWRLFTSFNYQTEKKVAVHTVNDPAEISFYTARGVDYIYTDFAQ